MTQSSRRPSSARWLEEHRTDPHVIAARREGYRSRSAYKLLEIQEKHQLLKPGMWVVDLGAAPGGWTQVAAKIVAPGGHVVALDLLPIAPLPGAVTLLQGNFFHEELLEKLRHALQGHQVQAVISDMAANISGIRTLDNSRGERLTEAVYDFTEEVLAPGGHLIIKIFHGESFATMVARGKKLFRTTRMVKPAASRDRSAEQYLIGMGFTGCSSVASSSGFSEE